MYLFVGREKLSLCIPSPGTFAPAIWGKGKAGLTPLSPEKWCQCQRQPLGNVIKADEKQAVDIFMSPEYSAWRFYGDHRKPERQWHSYPFSDSGEEQFFVSVFLKGKVTIRGHVEVSLIQRICGSISREGNGRILIVSRGYVNFSFYYLGQLTFASCYGTRTWRLCPESLPRSMQNQSVASS